MPSPRVLVLYNEPVLPRSHPLAESELGVLVTVDKINEALRESGCEVCFLAVGEDPEVLLSGLQAERPDVVFNLFEGLATQAGTEATVVGLLEWLGVPFTGSPASALALGLDKYRTKQLLRSAGLPTPAFFLLEGLPCPNCDLPWPVIVKPARQDASVGIEQASVVTCQKQLESRVALVLERFGPPVLIEQFIPGREFLVHLFEDTLAGPSNPTRHLLHVAELLFMEKAPGYWPIYSYDAKWTEESHEFDTISLAETVALEPGQLARLYDLTRQAYELIGCRDYGRLDVRMTAEGACYILEVNPNPNLNSGLVVTALEENARSYADFTSGLVKAAMARAPAPMLVYAGTMRNGESRRTNG